MSRKPERPLFRYQVIARFGEEPPRLISCHHCHGNAERRLLRLPLRPGESVEILEDGEVVQTLRAPSHAELQEIPF